MFESIKNVTTEHLEAARLALEAMFVLSGMGVVIGVALERDRFDFGWKLLVSSLGVEIVFTVLIFMTDAEISRRQKAEIVELEIQLAPRRITAIQQDEIARAISSFAGKRVRVESYGLDPEAAILGFQLKDALAKAHIVVDSGLMTKASGGSIAFGVHVTGKDAPLVKAMLDALGKANIAVWPDEPFPGGSVSFGVTISSTPPDAWIFVGVKPLKS